MSRHYLEETPEVFEAIPSYGNGERAFLLRDELLQTLKQFITENRRTGNTVLGPKVRDFEQWIEKTWSTHRAFGVNNGTMALRIGIEALGLQAGQEVITAGLTFIATSYAISDAFVIDPRTGTFSKRGLIPVFVDVDPQTYTLDPQAVEAAITERTAAIIPVHLHGQMADMLPLLDLAKKYDLFILEDASQAHGALYSDPCLEQRWYAGTMGDLGAFSLGAIKNMGALGDAGLITVNDRVLSRRPDIVMSISAQRNMGRTTRFRYLHEQWGERARMDDFTAMVCHMQLQYLTAWNQRRRSIAARYTTALEHNTLGLQAPTVARGREHVFFNYVVQAPDENSRYQCVKRLRSIGVQIDDGYTLAPDQAVYHMGTLPCRVEPLDAARHVVPLCISIPCYPELSENEVERIERVLAVL